MSDKQGISALIEDAYRRLQANDGAATLNDLIDLLNHQPGLFDLQGSARHLAAPEIRHTAILRCDGGDALGLSHVRRCLSIAASLSTNEGFCVRFAVIRDRAAAEAIREQGFVVDLMPEGAEEIDWLLDLAQYHKPSLWLLDVRTALTPHAVLRLKATDAVVAVLDDISARRLVADAAFYPPVPQVFALDWSLAEREPAVGWEWVPSQAAPQAAPRRQDAAPHVLVAFAGADPQGLCLTAVEALSAIDRPLRVTIVLAANAPETLGRHIEDTYPQFSVLRDPADMQGLIVGASIALISFGTLAWDLAASGVPALYVSLNEDHEITASAFARTGMGVTLGLSARVKGKVIADAVEDLLDDPEMRRSMAAAGLMNLDGRGATRIAARLHHLVEERREAFATPARQDASRTGT
jgi:spore coat polysaccharide biosynthesis protein SpsF